MLEVLPIQTKEEQRSACEKFGVEFKPELMAYAAYIDKELVGVCQFTMDDKGGHIKDLSGNIDVDNGQALFVTGRTALNFIDLCGVHYATFEGAGVSEAMIRSIGFTKNADGIYDVDLTHFFEHPCSHNK